MWGTAACKPAQGIGVSFSSAIYLRFNSYIIMLHANRRSDRRLDLYLTIWQPISTINHRSRRYTQTLMHSLLSYYHITIGYHQLNQPTVLSAVGERTTNLPISGLHRPFISKKLGPKSLQSVTH